MSPAFALPAPLCRPESSKDWDERRNVIEQLYWTEDMELPDVIDIMKEVYGFQATKKQYKSQLKRWGFEKNVKTGEMKAMLRIQKRRKADNKDTHFRLRNRPVPQQKLERFLKRQGMACDTASPAAPTPADIYYTTPKPSVHGVTTVTEPIVTGTLPVEEEASWADLVASSLIDLQDVIGRMETPKPANHGTPVGYSLGMTNFDGDATLAAFEALERASGSPGMELDRDDGYLSDASSSISLGSAESVSTPGTPTSEENVDGRVRRPYLSASVLLIHAGRDFPVDCGANMTTVQHAAFHGDVNQIRMLHHYGADVHSPMEGDLTHQQHGQKLRTLRRPTPLHLAVYGGHVEAVKALLEMGANVNATNSIGEMPILWAAYLGHAEVVKALVEKGASLETTARFKSPLQLATRYGNDDVVQVLQKLRADPDDRVPNSEMALGNAALTAH